MNSCLENLQHIMNPHDLKNSSGFNSVGGC